ncbi:DUF3575 domain-containing protein [Pedobacter sp. GSP4]|uniref:DUF3575 domain-containing protein n=1 Tax=Pedobacter sp. GSP4 TaxID=3453716 RepID=UPI003EEE3F9D
MKKTLLSLLTAALLGFAAQAQTIAIKANPLALLGGTDLVSGEFKIGDNSSVSAGLGAAGYKISGSKYSSFGGEAQYRYYFRESLHGWYVGAKAGYLAGKVKVQGFFDEKEYETKYGSLNAGVKGGYQWAFDSGFVIDLNLGAAYSSFKYDDNDGAFSSLKGSGILPNLGFGLGFAF